MEPAAASPSLRFANASRLISDAARGRSLAVPSFRCPPRLSGVDRSIRRRADGGCTVAVRLRGRPWAAVVADMVEGVIVANRLDGAEAMRVRTALWAAVEGGSAEAA